MIVVQRFEQLVDTALYKWFYYYYYYYYYLLLLNTICRVWYISSLEIKAKEKTGNWK